MKKIYIVATLLCLNNIIIAQDNVGIGTLTPNTKSVLDLSSNTKGFLAPRMSTAERLAIAPTLSEAALMVFDTDLSRYLYWDGTQWVEFPGAGDDWSLTGNAGTNVANNYIGTSDAAGLSIRTNATERIRITAQTGFVGIGTAPSYPLDVLNQTRITRANASIANTNESNLELFNGSAGDVFISFHKAGVWGAHFGLDATNWFSTTGWSAGTGFTSMRVGNIQANGGAQVTGLSGAGNAPVFADATGNLFRSSGGVNAPVQIYSFTFNAFQSSGSSGFVVPTQEFDTGIPVASYDCVIADYSTNYDMNENNPRRRKNWLYQNANGNWFYSVAFGAHSNGSPAQDNIDVKVLCFSTATTNWNGNPRDRNINYGTP